MSWCKVDDQFADHPKFVGLSNDAVALWLRGLAYCNRHMTDGEIKVIAVPALANHRKAMVIAAELVRAGLWEVPNDSTFKVHDFLVLNDSKTSRIKKLDEARARKERHRNKSSGRFGDAPGTRSNDVPGRVPGRVPPASQDAFQTASEHPPDADAEDDAYVEISNETPPPPSPPGAPRDDRSPVRDGGGLDDVIRRELARSPMTDWLAQDSHAIGVIVSKVMHQGLPYERIPLAIEWAVEKCEIESAAIAGGHPLSAEITLAKVVSGIKGEHTKWQKEPRKALAPSESPEAMAARAAAAKRLASERGI